MAIRVHYVAYDRAGSPVRGVLEAPSVHAAEETLWSSGLIVARVSRARSLPSPRKLFPSLARPRPRTTIAVARQLATLLEAGFPLWESLAVLSGEQTHQPVRQAIDRMREDLAAGRSFSEALGKHPALFPAVFVRLARIGEETGELAPLLRRAADQLESGVSLRAKVRATLTYPAIVVLTAGAALYVLLTFSIPMLAGLLEEFDAELPLMTRVIVAVAAGFNVWAGRVVVLLAAIGLALAFSRRTQRGRLATDRALLFVPLTGGVLRNSAVARTGQTLHSLLQSGIPLLEALDLTVAATDNLYLRQTLLRVRGRLLEGASLSAALQGERAFPALMREMVRVGESSGTLTEQMETIGRIYQNEFEGTIGRLVALMEPAMILGVGALVGLIGVTIITTVYSVLPSARGAM